MFVVAHRHKSSHHAPVEDPRMGRGSESPPELPHIRTDSERESKFWNLHAWAQTNKHTFTNMQSLTLFSTATQGKYE